MPWSSACCRELAVAAPDDHDVARVVHRDARVSLAEVLRAVDREFGSQFAVRAALACPARRCRRSAWAKMPKLFGTFSTPMGGTGRSWKLSQAITKSPSASIAIDECCCEPREYVLTWNSPATGVLSIGSELPTFDLEPVPSGHHFLGPVGADQLLFVVGNRRHGRPRDREVALHVHGHRGPSLAARNRLVDPELAAGVDLVLAVDVLDPDELPRVDVRFVPASPSCPNDVHVTTKSPVASMATDGNSWSRSVASLTRSAPACAVLRRRDLDLGARVGGRRAVGKMIQQDRRLVLPAVGAHETNLDVDAADRLDLDVDAHGEELGLNGRGGRLDVAVIRDLAGHVAVPTQRERAVGIAVERDDLRLIDHPQRLAEAVVPHRVDLVAVAVLALGLPRDHEIAVVVHRHRREPLRVGRVAVHAEGVAQRRPRGVYRRAKTSQPVWAL